MKQNYSRKLWPVKALAVLVKIVRCLSCQRSLSAVIVIILKHFLYFNSPEHLLFCRVVKLGHFLLLHTAIWFKKNMATSLLPLSCYQIASNMLDVL